VRVVERVGGVLELDLGDAVDTPPVSRLYEHDGSVGSSRSGRCHAARERTRSCSGHRQLAYARRLGTGTYTPQMIVAGAHAFVGSDTRSATAAVKSARDEPGGEVTARWRPEGGGAIEVSARWQDHVEAQVLVAFVQDHATSRVARGENAGRTLEHVAVVRELSVAGAGMGAFSGRVTSPAPAGANRVVVFVQARDGGRVHGVAEVEFQPPSDVPDHPHGAWR